MSCISISRQLRLQILTVNAAAGTKLADWKMKIAFSIKALKKVYEDI